MFYLLKVIQNFFEFTLILRLLRSKFGPDDKNKYLEKFMDDKNRSRASTRFIYRKAGTNDHLASKPFISLVILSSKKKKKNEKKEKNVKVIRKRGDKVESPTWSTRP